MESSSVIYQISVHRYVLVEVLIDAAVTGWRWLAHQGAEFARKRRQERARRDLHRLSDHCLRDIGLERDQIERLFR